MSCWGVHFWRKTGQHKNECHFSLSSFKSITRLVVGRLCSFLTQHGKPHPYKKFPPKKKIKAPQRVLEIFPKNKGRPSLQQKSDSIWNTGETWGLYISGGWQYFTRRRNHNTRTQGEIVHLSRGGIYSQSKNTKHHLENFEQDWKRSKRRGGRRTCSATRNLSAAALTVSHRSPTLAVWLLPPKCQPILFTAHLCNFQGCGLGPTVVVVRTELDST